MVSPVVVVVMVTMDSVRTSSASLQCPDLMKIEIQNTIDQIKSQHIILHL